MSIEMAMEDYPFNAIIMAAMRRADTSNLEMLKRCWPKIWDELVELYNTPGAYMKREQSED